MDLINKDKVNNNESPNDSLCNTQIKSIPFPTRHKQIKKPKHKKAIAVKCDIHNKE